MPSEPGASEIGSVAARLYSAIIFATIVHAIFNKMKLINKMTNVIKEIY